MLVLHPGSHLQAGEEAGLAQIVKGLDGAMEGMDYTAPPSRWKRWPARAASLAVTFQQLRWIFIHHARYGNHSVSAWIPVICTMPVMMSRHLDGLLAEVRIGSSGFSEAAVLCACQRFAKTGGAPARTDMPNIGFGEIGFEALNRVRASSSGAGRYRKDPENACMSDGHAPYGHEIAMLKEGRFDADAAGKDPGRNR
ncbi:MAG: hypothetical protein V8T10_00990 [Merdibacter sp.]